ncbi:MAG TPA: hypothetical protein VIG69_11835 [Candidatus Methylomirabilis sp.]|jgi:ribosomal protein S17
MWKVWGVVAVVTILALQGAAALAAEEARVHAASGTVVAVMEASKTIVIESKLDGKPWIIGAEVADDTKFAGKAKGLKDLKPGDRVTMQWVRREQGDVVRSIALR